MKVGASWTNGASRSSFESRMRSGLRSSRRCESALSSARCGRKWVSAPRGSAAGRSRLDALRSAPHRRCRSARSDRAADLDHPRHPLRRRASPKHSTPNWFRLSGSALLAGARSERTGPINKRCSDPDEQVVFAAARAQSRPSAGTQGHAAIRLVAKRVHLFFDDVVVSPTPRSNSSVASEHRRGGSRRTEAVGDVAALGLEAVPIRRLGRSDVLRARGR